VLVQEKMVGTENSNTIMNGKYKANNDDLMAVNMKLYLLLQTTNIEISFDVFCILLNLLRNGVTPEAIYVFLKQVSMHSKILKKFKKLAKSHKNICNNNTDTKTLKIIN